jgi:galactokinase
MQSPNPMLSTHADLSSNTAFKTIAESLYGKEAVPGQLLRFQALLSAAASHGHDQVRFFSTPGRSELAGNHTDHNHGKVLAAAIDLDAIAAAAPRDDSRVSIASEGFPTVDISVRELGRIPCEAGTTAALVRGIAARLALLGHAVGGFDAFVHSEVLPGSGLSSSAVIEVLVASIFNHLFNGGRLGATEIAQVAQYAENEYFGKPCGLMDPMTCATGGVVSIDFADPLHPAVRRVTTDLEAQDVCLVIVDTGSSHADLTSDYAAIPQEMKAVARAFGLTSCRGLAREQFLARLPELRPRLGDRAMLRVLHYLAENERVDAQIAALEAGRFQDFLTLVRESGLSSFRWLQNVLDPAQSRTQGVALALALTEQFLGSSGACRVHGGGFAGTIQAWIPKHQLDAFRAAIEPVFGVGAVKPLRIRSAGTTSLP